jgi:hypothetical protein
VAMALADARPADGTRPLAQASALDGLLLGLAQTCALVPGVSRRGEHGALKTGRLLQRGAARGTPIPGGRALLLGGGASFLSTLVATRLLRRDRAQPATALWPYALYRGLLSACVGRRLREAHNKNG